jgi:hypothetical protein
MRMLMSVPVMMADEGYAWAMALFVRRSSGFRQAGPQIDRQVFVGFLSGFRQPLWPTWREAAEGSRILNPALVAYTTKVGRCEPVL